MRGRAKNQKHRGRLGPMRRRDEVNPIQRYRRITRGEGRRKRRSRDEGRESSKADERTIKKRRI